MENMGEIVEFPSESVASESVSDTKVAFPKAHSVKIGEVDYPVPTFKLGKSMLMLEALSELVEQGEITSFFHAAAKGQESFLEELIERLPVLFKRCRPLLYRMMALTLIPDTKMMEIDANGEDIELEIARVMQVLKYEADIEKAMEIIPIAVDGMGLDTIRKNFPMLLKKLGSV
jgi:hypothetical protein